MPESGSCGAGRDPHDLDSGVALRRERTLRKLRFACADGRLTLDELVRRTQAAYTATTYDELRRVTADLPRPGGATVGRARRGARRLLVGILGLSGRWLFPALRPRVLAVAAIGEVAIDLRYTPVTSFETEITAVALLGEVRIVVPPGCQVETDGEFTMLGYTRLPEAEAPGTLVPVLRLRTLTVLGDVRVERME